MTIETDLYLFYIHAGVRLQDAGRVRDKVRAYLRGDRAIRRLEDFHLLDRFWRRMLPGFIASAPLDATTTTIRGSYDDYLRGVPENLRETLCRALYDVLCLLGILEWPAHMPVLHPFDLLSLSGGLSPAGSSGGGDETTSPTSVASQADEDRLGEGLFDDAAVGGTGAEAGAEAPPARERGDSPTIAQQHAHRVASLASVAGGAYVSSSACERGRTARPLTLYPVELLDSTMVFRMGRRLSF